MRSAALIAAASVVDRRLNAGCMSVLEAMNTNTTRTKAEASAPKTIPILWDVVSWRRSSWSWSVM